MKNRYWLATRPREVDHRHPVLVFDRNSHLHVPLTVFAKAAANQLSSGTARAYLHAILPFFEWLETDEWQKRARRHWSDPPEPIRHCLEDYLLQRLGCKVRRHRLGFHLVSLSEGTRSTVRVLLSGMKLFYRVMAESHHYRYSNPLVDNLSVTLSKMEEGLERKENTPRMPDISGVVVPNRKKRLSDSYFKLEEDTWIPKIIDDPTLPIQVLRGGERLRWGLREKCLARILFESGGRISEVTGLTLRDWVVRGTLQEVAAFSKGSHRRRVKFLRFSAATAKLLRRYFDTDRRRFDPHGWDLDQYLVRFGKRASELSTVPLFLSSRRTQIMPKAFRERYWNPACQAAGIEVDIHQARHWCVTMAVRHI